MSATEAKRRKLGYSSLQEVLKDAEEQVRHRVATIGNWSLGKIFEHLATVMDKSIDGFEFKAPFPVRLVGKFCLKRKFLREGMPAGFRLRGKAAEELVPGEITTEDGLEYLRNAIRRLQTETRRLNQECTIPVFLCYEDLSRGLACFISWFWA